MRTRGRNRIIDFDVVGGHLEKQVSFPDDPSRDYTHRCPEDIFKDVAHSIEERAKQGSTLDELAEAMDQPHSQVATALAFLKERGCVEVRLRRTYPASVGLFEDAMIEFCYLAQKQGV